MRIAITTSCTVINFAGMVFDLYTHSYLMAGASLLVGLFCAFNTYVLIKDKETAVGS